MSNLPVIPDPPFSSTDPSQIINDIMNGYSLAAGRTLQQSDPVYLFMLALAYRIVQERLRAQYEIEQQLLYFATGAMLDQIGASRQTPREGAAAAISTARFTLSAIRPGVILIPKGTRVTADNILYFATKENAEIPAGQMSVDVDIEALVAGEDGNGILIGEITTIVDPIAYVQSVENITNTQGGANIEDDEHYRERIYNAPSAYSVAGPVDAYKTIAKSTSTLIIDVSATSPTPGTAEIRPLMEGGEIPTQTILDAVYDKLSKDTVRPLTDHVVVLAPTVKSYNVNYIYYISSQNAARAAEIQTAVSDATSNYNLWQRSKLGRDINPDELISLVKAAGAKRLVVTSPVFEVVAESEVARSATVSITYGGLENE